MPKRPLTVLALLCGLGSAVARADAPSASSARSASEKPTTGWAALPIASYTPETQLGGGAFGSYFYRLGDAGPETRPSSLSAVVLYTWRKQLITELIPELYWDKERWHAWNRLDYRYYPSRMWGVGNGAPDASEETFTEDRWRWQGRIGREVQESLWIYGHFELIELDLRNKVEGGMLAEREVTGALGGRTVGFGPGIAWDSRDHLLVPRHGSFHELIVMTWQEPFGSEYRFTGLRVNIRKYLPIGRTQALALQFYGELQAGEVPFFKLAQLGGENLLRGYFEGRYRDKTLIALQAEYRVPVYWRFSAVVHAGVGEVAASPTQFSFSSPEWSVGVGGRIMLNTDEQLNLRADVGFGHDTFGVYVGIAEAF